MRRISVMILFGALVLPAHGQAVTVCEGTSSCVEVSGGQARRLSDAEVHWKNIEDARNALSQVKCSVSVDYERCAELKAEIAKLLR